MTNRSDERRDRSEQRGSGRTLQRRALHALRKLTSTKGGLETGLRSARNAARYMAGRPVVRRDVFARKGGRGKRLGVFGLGGCDVRTIVGAGPILSRRHEGPLCIGSFGFAPESRSDLIVQTLDPPDPDVTADVSKELGLSGHYFAPVLFEESFTVPDQIGLGRWPKDVVVLSISSDVGRTVYRHKEHGFLVDPGGWWLAADMTDVLGDLSAVKWFAANFSKTPRISVDDSVANFERIIEEVRKRTGAYVVVMNVLTVDPGSTALDYKHANSPNRLRRREFKEAFSYLGQKMDFPVLDVDRLTKQLGISGQADFVHYTAPQKRLISQEFAGVLSDAGVVEASREQRLVRTR